MLKSLTIIIIIIALSTATALIGYSGHSLVTSARQTQEATINNIMAE